ncbi:MAG: Eco47II family restriction endonuclease [Spirochaetaceae bacterium]
MIKIHMSYLPYITDDRLLELVKEVLNVGIAKKETALKEFNKNVIDPFGAYFEAGAFNIDYITWVESETIRQCQKTLQNHIGDFHQKILGSVEGFDDLGVGANSGVDLECKSKMIVAEIKNKHNTVTGGKLADQYYSLERQVMPKSSTYKGYTAYFVNIIPKKPERFNIPFTPSDKDKGSQCPANELIRRIDGASFYTLVTGYENALEQLHNILPTVIEKVLSENFNLRSDLTNSDEFSKYFNLAYKKQE